jgi:hypothetical protein
MANHRLKSYAKTARSRRRVPLRAKVLDALDQLPRRDGVLFPASEGGRINIDNFRSREWVPALQAAGVEHRRIYDMRHTFATWSPAAGMSIFTLARRMGTRVQMIDATYGHLARDAEDQDPWPARRLRHGQWLWARIRPRTGARAPPRTRKPCDLQGFQTNAPERIRTSDLRFRRPTTEPPSMALASGIHRCRSPINRQKVRRGAVRTRA